MTNRKKLDPTESAKTHYGHRLRKYRDRHGWSPASRVKLEALMKRSGPYLRDAANQQWAGGKAEGRAEGIAEGKAERTAEAIIIVLFSRKIAITDEERTKVLECTDTAQLETWLRRAATVESAEDVFAD